MSDVTEKEHITALLSSDQQLSRSSAKAKHYCSWRNLLAFCSVTCLLLHIRYICFFAALRSFWSVNLQSFSAISILIVLFEKCKVHQIDCLLLFFSFFKLLIFASWIKGNHSYVKRPGIHSFNTAKSNPSSNFIFSISSTSHFHMSNHTLLIVPYENHWSIICDKCKISSIHWNNLYCCQHTEYNIHSVMFI